jgi:short-subunit dehydrogenase
MSLANQVAIITGASTGIGHALARALAREGCKVGLLARRRELLDQLRDDIRAAGGVAECASANVAERRQTVAAIHDLAARLGPVDLLVANAGTGGPTTIEPFNVDVQERVVQVNFLGVIYSIEAVLPEMLKRGRGHLAAVSSQAAYKGLPGEMAYTSSKAAVNNYMEGLRIQLRRRNIAVTTICPGFVKTPMTDVNQFHMPWMMSADEAARRIVRSLRRRRKVYNFPWQTTLLMRLTRWLPDWLVARVLLKHQTPRPKEIIP